jgi:hypothetical protein
MSAGFRTNLSYALLMTIVLALTLVSLGLAHGVENEVSLDSVTQVITAGDSAAVELWIKDAAHDGAVYCNAADGTTATISFQMPAGVVASPHSLTFDACQTGQQVAFRADVPGDYQILVKVYDKGKGAYKPVPTGLTLVVQAPADTTPPAVSFDITGILGMEGWYTSKVFVDWSVIDRESPVSFDKGCLGTFVTYDSSGVTSFCKASSAGGTTELMDVTIKVDATPPQVVLLGGPQDGGSYRQGFVPSQPECAASDNKSGVSGGCQVTGYADTPGAHTVTATARDIAGNQATVSATYQVLP